MQHSAKLTLPTGLHKMVMRTVLSADNEIDAATQMHWLWLQIGCLFHSIENIFTIARLCLTASVSTIQKKTIDSEMSIFLD